LLAKPLGSFFVDDVVCLIFPLIQKECEDWEDLSELQGDMMDFLEMVVDDQNLFYNTLPFLGGMVSIDYAAGDYESDYFLERVDDYLSEETFSKTQEWESFEYKMLNYYAQLEEELYQENAIVEVKEAIAA